MGDTSKLPKFGDGTRSVEEERAIQSAGGKASGKAKRLRKSMREVLILALEALDKDSGRTKQEIGVERLVEAFAETGDVRVFESICRTLGEDANELPTINITFDKDAEDYSE